MYPMIFFSAPHKVTNEERKVSEDMKSAPLWAQHDSLMFYNKTLKTPKVAAEEIHQEKIVSKEAPRPVAKEESVCNSCKRVS